MEKKINFAILSGFCASLASTFGKLCGLPSLEGYFPIRVLFFICMITCNGAVWTQFVKALQHSESSLIATVTSSASNYLFSTFTGFLLFGEITSLLWWLGMFFILVGLLLILRNELDVDCITVRKVK